MKQSAILKTLFVSCLLIVSSFGGVKAQSGLSSVQRAVGYCYRDSITYENVAFGQEVTYTVGAVANSSMLAPYVGCRVVGIRFALSQSIGNTKLVVARKTGAQTVDSPIVEQTLRRTYEGWQNVFFNSANEFTIEEDDNLFFGFNYTETSEMVEAGTGAMCSFGTEEIEGGFCLLSNNTLYNITGAGCLCVQLIVDVTNMPRKAVKTTFFDTGFKYKKTGEKTELFYTIANSGRENISALTIAYQLDDDPVVKKTFSTKLDEAQSDSYSISIDKSITLPVGAHTVKTYVTNIDGEDFETPAKDTLRTVFMIYETPLKRQKQYFEQYTSSAEVMAYHVNPIFNQVTKNHPDDMVLVNVHRQGTPLAVDESSYLEDLYAYTWPSFTINRAYYPGENHVAYDVNDYATIDQSLVVSIINDMIEQEKSMPAFAQMDINATYDEPTRELSVTVNGVLSPDAEAMFGQLALTLLLTEDDVRSAQTIVNVLGRVTTNNNYQHNNVLRAFISAAKGDVVTVSDNIFTATYKYTVPATWNADNLNIVAYMTQKHDKTDSYDEKNMDIIGANSIYVKDAAKTAVEQIWMHPADNQYSTADVQRPTFNLMGQRVGSNYHGIVVRQGTKVVVK